MQRDLHVEFGKRLLREIMVVDFHYKITGKEYNETLGQIHFWVFFIGVNVTFFPMHWLGVAGMPRRIPDYPDAFYTFNKIASWGAEISAFSLVIFVFVVLEALTTSEQSTNKLHH
jgi:cytochrome c oxidase subunit I